ncbi:hypothetical protein [Periweissella ghanensis]|uniref:Uncharacterized protein n=1 Tax=Periweissella ghanensis TaxID=467997 RepID=A0ABM8ZEU4_9LACO|nr:hypothetical protein [Periweissella ghanensis]MCM0600318.1 hypothetical protein [Periweissella ghanensis]CAH0419230.1 hypothetical protein WGH24286_01677 [Periweissella ghanensis]
MLYKFKPVVLWSMTYISFLLCVHFISPLINNASLEGLVIIVIIILIDIIANYAINHFNDRSTTEQLN